MLHALLLLAQIVVVPDIITLPTLPTQASKAPALTFDYDATDLDVVDGFEVGFFASETDTTPVSVGTMLRKDDWCIKTCIAPIVTHPLSSQTWWVGVRAVAGSNRSTWSALVAFDFGSVKTPLGRTPAVPVNVKVREK
jgi:hypothetical protein